MPAEILTLPVDRVVVTKIGGPFATAAPHVSMYAIDAVSVNGETRQYETTNAWKASQCEQSRRHQSIVRVHYRTHPRFQSKDIVRVELDS